MQQDISEEQARKIVGQDLDQFARSRNMFTRPLNTEAALKCVPMAEGWACVLEGEREQIALTLGKAAKGESLDRRQSPPDRKQY